MALDKLVDSTQLDADLTSVANAIRTKGGTSAQLAFPAGFVSAIEAIETGASDIEWIEYTAAATTNNVPALLNAAFPGHSDSDTAYWLGELIRTASGEYVNYNLLSFVTITKNGTTGAGVRWRTNTSPVGQQNFTPVSSTWTCVVTAGDTVKLGRVPK